MIRTHSNNFIELIVFNLLIYLNFFFNASHAYYDFKTLAPPTKVYIKTEFVPTNSGPCRADIKMYYFDPTTKNCSAFTWGGCQGNGNRFDTEDECLNYCLSHASDRPKSPSYCSLTFDYGYCFGSVERWYYDRQYQVCRKTLYSGCGGNDNNFYNEEMCNKICTFGQLPFTTRKPKRITDNVKRIIIINPHGITTSTLNYITRTTNLNSSNTTVPDETVTTRRIYITPYSTSHHKWGYWRRRLPYHKKNETS